MADSKEYTLSLILKVLTEGAKDILGIKKGIEGVDKAAAKKVPDPTEKMRAGMKATNSVATGLRGTLGRLFAVGAVVEFGRAIFQAANRAQSSFLGLQSIAEHAGVGIGEALKEASRLAEDGLISVTETSRALQNLLSRGYNVEQAVQTIEHLKDAAAFNRQANLKLGAAVVTATEGLKNENSVLVDNAGVTKNVSILWKEYADQIGVSVKNLTKQQKVQAEVNGIMRETAGQAGNAAKAAAGLQGSMARLSKQTDELNAALGLTFVPLLQTSTDKLTKLVNFIKGVIGGWKNFYAQTVFAFKAIGKNAEEQARLYREYRKQVRETVDLYEKGLTPAARAAIEANRKHAESEKAAAEAAALAGERIAKIKQQTTEVIKAELADQIRAEETASKRLEELQQQRQEVAQRFADAAAELQAKARKAPEDLTVLDVTKATREAKAALDEADFQTALEKAEKARKVIQQLARQGQPVQFLLKQQLAVAARLADQAGQGLEDVQRAKVETARSQIKKLLGEAEALKKLDIGFDLEVAKKAADDVVAIIKETLSRLAIPVTIIPVLEGGDGADKKAGDLLKNAAKKAGGGMLDGIGTGTSDSNLYWGSRGEFVQPYKSVQRYGVRFMEAIRRGLLDPRAARAMLSAPRFAEGGLIAMNRLTDRAPGIAFGSSGTPVILQLGDREFNLSAPGDTAADLTRAVKIEALKQGKRA